jgi:hypothetical protein
MPLKIKQLPPMWQFVRPSKIFSETSKPINVLIHFFSNASRQSFASQVDEAIGQLQAEPKFLDAPEDSDDWLNVDAEGFEQMLEASRAKLHGNETKDPNGMDVDESPEDRIASEQAKRLKDLASKVENFIEGEGDVEGARFEEYVIVLPFQPCY